MAGGGKSWSLLFDALKYVDCPHYYGVFFRKTNKQLERSLWPEAKNMYRQFLVDQEGKYKGKAQIREGDKKIIFPSGAVIEFSYIDDNNVEDNWQGAELTGVYWDEFTHYSEYVYNYVRTRLRSKSKYRSYMRAGLNPHPTHFIHKYLDLFICQESGFAIKEYSGRPAYYIFDKGQLVTSWSEEDLIERYPTKKPRKYTFCPSSLSDNKKMLEYNDTYEEDLEANDPANAAMLLKGNWKYTPAANGVFSRSVITESNIVTENQVPDGCTYFRAYDKASAVPTTEGGDSKTMDPDYTCSIMLAKDSDNFLYVLGSYIRNIETQEQIARFRQKPGPRDKTIEKQCLYDIERYGDSVYCILPQDPGQAGASELQQASKALQEVGVKVKKDPSHSNKSKQIRFEPYCISCFNGNVFWVKETFDKATWDYMLLELENFNPDTKNNGFHDDLVDCFSSAFAAANQTKVAKPFTLPDISSPTMLSNFKQGRR